MWLAAEGVRLKEGNRTSAFVGRGLLGWSALLWKLLLQVPKGRTRMDLWVLVAEHFGQACKIWGSLSSTSFSFPEALVNCHLRS